MDDPSKEIVNQISKLSSSREKYVMEMRLGINSDRTHTLQEIADKLELSRERVRQIQHRALLKLAKVDGKDCAEVEVSCSSQRT
jgi:RNA polymerase primary sigma factor